jgi:hypothetical protein
MLIADEKATIRKSKDLMDGKSFLLGLPTMVV